MMRRAALGLSSRRSSQAAAVEAPAGAALAAPAAPAGCGDQASR
jgi:hypothetical protein